MNTFIRQRVAADKYNIQLVIHVQDNTYKSYTQDRQWTELFKSNTTLILIK